MFRPFATIAAVVLFAATAANAQQEDTAMTHEVSGEFDVKMTPADTSGAVGRMALDKVYHGPLSATAKGEMLAHRTAVEGSAVYVAMEQVTGTLEGKSGTFVLAHRGVMDRGKPQLSVDVAPDSGTGELVGLTGRMAIDITGGKHVYTFTFALPQKAKR